MPISFKDSPRNEFQKTWNTQRPILISVSKEKRNEAAPFQDTHTHTHTHECRLCSRAFHGPAGVQETRIDSRLKRPTLFTQRHTRVVQRKQKNKWRGRKKWWWWAAVVCVCVFQSIDDRNRPVICWTHQSIDADGFRYTHTHTHTHTGVFEGGSFVCVCVCVSCNGRRVMKPSRVQWRVGKSKKWEIKKNSTPSDARGKENQIDDVPTRSNPVKTQLNQVQLGNTN